MTEGGRAPLTPMAPSGVPSRDDDSPPHASPADGGEDRARALADFFGAETDSSLPQAHPSDPSLGDRLAEFFARPSRPDQVDASPPVTGAAGPSTPAAAVPSTPAPTMDDFRADAVEAPADHFEAEAPPSIQPEALREDDDDLFAFDDDDLLSYDTDDLFVFDENGELIPLEDAEDAEVEASALPPSVAPPGLTINAASVEANPAEVATPPRKPAKTRPPSKRAVKRQARSAAKAAAAAQAAKGEFASTPRGMRAWSKGTWWAVGSAVVLVLALVGGSVYVSQLLQAQAQQLETATAEFEAAADAADDPVPAMEAAYAEYDTTAAAARAAADSAAPALAAVAGMSDQAALDAANAAAGAIIPLLDSTTLPERPAAYAPPEAASFDGLQAAESATADARAYASDVTAVTEEVKAATAAVTQHVTALTEAQRALGATLPATAEAIAAENDLARQQFREDVIAAAAAIGAAQSAGASGDAELLAYAAAVAALREAQQRAEEEASRRFYSAPVTPEPQPEPVAPTQEQAPPAEQPQPVPAPEPTEPVTP